MIGLCVCTALFCREIRYETGGYSPKLAGAGELRRTEYGKSEPCGEGNGKRGDAASVPGKAANRRKYPIGAEKRSKEERETAYSFG